MPRISHAVPIVAALAFAPLAATAAGTTCHADSGAHTTALIELYTSEGCDSCPPADRWLARNVAAGESADAIALAFHVDYWDRLGWKDRFASAAYTERQYDSMRMNGGRFVYTPQVLISGHELDWRSGAPARSIAAINARPAHAKITLAATLAGDRVAIRADAAVDNAAGARKPTLAIALVDNGLVSDVKAGENRGVRLAHDHVVRDYLTGAIGRATIEWTLPKEAGHTPTVVAFVQDAANGDVLQALALPLAACAR